MAFFDETGVEAETPAAKLDARKPLHRAMVLLVSPPLMP
jgi:hypothetical protein